MILAPHGPRPQGGAQGRVRRDPQGRLAAGPGRRPGGRRRTRRPQLVAPEVAPHRGGDRPRGDPRRASRPRLAESINLAVRHGDGLVLASYEEKQPAGGSRAGTTAVQHAVRLPELQDQLRGAGAADLQLQQPLRGVPDVRGAGRPRGVRSGAGRAGSEPVAGRGGDRAVEASRRPRCARHKACCEDFLAAAGIRWNTPLAKLDAEGPRSNCLQGDGKRFPGVLTLLEKEYATTARRADAAALEAFRGQVVCPECGGARLRPEARSVRVAGKAIHEVTALTVAQAREFFAGLSFAEDEQPIAQPIVGEIASRLEFLDRVGLDYLTLDRPADTLSGGELQRGAPGHRAGLRTGRRVLRAGRALDRAAPPRQPAADRRPARIAVPRQHRGGRRARRERSCARPIG